MVDPNIYALNIMLQLDTTAAFTSIDDFSERIVEVEQNIAEMGQRTINQLQTSIETLDVGITRVSGKIRDIQDEGRILSKAFDKTNLANEEIVDNHDEQLKNLQKQHKLTEKVRDVADEIVKFGEEELERVEEYNSQLDKLIERIETKNKAHERELGLVTDEVGMADQLYDRQRDIGDQISTNTRRYIALGDVLRQILGLMQDIDKETENFVTTNYRYYGSQSAILQQVRLLTAEHGLFYASALETYKLLADLRVPQDEILRYTKAISMASRFTGVGERSLVNYVQRLRQVGITAPMVERQLVFMSDAMRKLGLNTEDINRSIQSTTISAAELELMFTGENQAAKFEQLKIVIAGLAKQMGFSTETADAFMNSLMDPMARAQFEGWTGQSINNVEDMQKAMVIAGRKVKEMTGRMEELKAAGDSAGAMAIQTELGVMADLFAGGSKEALLMLGRLEEVAAAMNLDLENAQDLEKAMAAVRQEVEGPFNEANNTLTAQFGILADRITSLIKMAIQPLADWLRDVLKAINQYIDEELPKFIAMWNAVWAAVDQSPILSAIWSLMKSGAAIIGGLTLAVGALVVAFGGLPLVAIAAGFGIRMFFNAVSQGLLALGRAVQQVMVPLLALSVAFLITGAGAFLLAKGAAAIAEHGWNAVPAIIGLVAAIGILGLILWGLATLVQGPVLIGLLAVSAAFLSLGLTAVMMAGALWIGAKAFDIFVGTLQKLIDMDVVAAGIDLNVLGIFLLTASALLLAAGLIMVPASVLLLLAAGALWAAGIIMVPASEMLDLSGKLLYAGGGMLLEASIKLFASGVLLAAGGVLLLAGAIALGLATMALSPVGIAMIIVGAAMMFGAYMLHEGSKHISASSILISESAGPLYAGAIVLGMAADALLSAGLTLSLAAIPLVIGATATFAAGMLVQMAGGAMLGGSINLYAASIMLASTTAVMTQAIGDLASTVVSAGILMTAATMLAAAGLILVPAVLVLKTGMSWLADMATKFATIAPHVAAIGQGLLNLANSFAMLSQVRPDILGSLADRGLEAIPRLERFAGQLQGVAGQVDAAAQAFMVPADNLTKAVSAIGNALSDFEMRNVAFGSKLGDVGLQLEAYTVLLEGAAQRIETAVMTKAMPALQEVERAGLDDIVQSEAISTVQVMDKREGNTTDKTEGTLETVAGHLAKIIELVQPMASGNDSHLVTIEALLEQYLPEIATSEGKTLSNEMNQWMR